jgi:glycosyltransferase involved in cell wall biosynthesis
MLERLREWDRRTVERVTHFVAISRTVQERIADCYGQSSEVIYPPVDTEYYTPAAVARGDYYLVVSAFAPYKRLDLAVAACQKMGRDLVIIGAGQDERRLASLVGGRVRLLGWQPNGVIRDHLRRCRALLFPGEEDFGIVPLEAHACGAPVIAFGRGGATETVMPLGGRREPTGVWFEEQSVDGLCAALQRFEAHRHEFAPHAARRQALRFAMGRYREEMLAYIGGVLQPSKRVARRAA